MGAILIVIGVICGALSLVLIPFGFYKLSQHKDDKGIVSERTIEDSFLRLQLSLTEIRKAVLPEQIRLLPNYLQEPYDMNIAISNVHGVGVEFITPSNNPEINISKTDMPIEKYYFSKYTDEKDYTKLKVVVRNKHRRNVLDNFTLVGSKEMVAIEDEGDLVLKNIIFKYSPTDTPRNIDFLWLFGSNQETYWKKCDPSEMAKHVFDAGD